MTFRTLAVTLVLLNVAGAARAQWPAEVGGKPVCDALRTQNSVVATTDGRDGAIFVWQDMRADESGDIYAQRMSKDGVPLWNAGGVPVVTATAPRITQVVTDGASGCIIIWEELSTVPGPKLMAQRVSATGTVLWPGVGVRLSSAYTVADFPIAIADGQGGVVLAWTDNRAEGLNGTDIRGQRMNGQGLPLWPVDGLPVSVARGNQSHPSIALASDGAVLLAWRDDRSYEPGSQADVYAQRVTAAGTMLWPGNGLLVATASGPDASPDVVRDAAGGVLIAWANARSGGTGEDIFAQHIDSAGNALWAPGGLQATDVASPKHSHATVTDGDGGLIVTWREWRGYPRFTDVYAQRVDASGATRWMVNGVPVCDRDLTQALQDAVSDGAGGVIMVWEDFRATFSSDIYAQRLSANGEPLWGAGGLAISNFGVDESQPSLVSGGTSTAIIGWHDAREARSREDVFAARIRPDGVYGTTYLPDRFALETITADTSLAAGTPFDLRIVAETMSGFVAHEFDGAVNVGSDGELAAGEGTTATFKSGVLATHAVSFAHSGRYRLHISDAASEVASQSDELVLRPPTPAMFTVVPSPNAERQVTLSWLPSATGDARHYDVFRATHAIVDTLGLRVKELGPVTTWTDTVPDFGTYHYLVRARDVHDISSLEAPERAATATPLFFDLATVILQNHAVTRHLDVVVEAESLLTGVPMVSLTTVEDSTESEILLTPVPGGFTTFSGSFEITGGGTQIVRTRATSPDGRQADRVRSFRAVPVPYGESARVTSPGGEVTLVLPAGELLRETCFLAESGTSMMDGTAWCRFGPEGELGFGAAIEWLTGRARLSDAAPLDDASHPTIARRDGETWTPLPTTWNQASGVLSAQTERLGEFRLVMSAGSPPLAGDLEARLGSAYPNPFIGGTRIQWSVPENATLDLVIYDLAGRRVRTLMKGVATHGNGEAAWDGRDDVGRSVAPGLYLIELRTARRADTRKVLLLE